MKPLVTLLVTLCLAVPASAAPPHHMPVVVQSDRIQIGYEFVPRYLDLPQVLVVPAGKTVTASPDSTWDYIEVAGTLRIARDRDTVLRFTHLFVLPGGVLDAGTQADPIPAGRRVELVVRDVPIDTARDPFQWGNGLLNFSKQTRVGAAKTAWTMATGDIAAGATALTLAADPRGWQVGDELLLPDSRQTKLPASPRRESPVTIAAIDGRTVTLSKPLDFEHLVIRDPDGGVVLLPRVANLTRNIVIRSETLSPETGTPGHTADIGEHATWDVRYNELAGLGRTRGIPLDNALLATKHVGTNQAGRYNDHHHHAQGFGSFTIGNVNRGNGRVKWGVVVHGTHDARIEDTITVGFPGAGFVTEDGYETRNVFRHNFAAYSIGNHKGDTNIETANARRDNNPGAAGNGFWARGVTNTFEANEAWNNSSGFNMFNQDTLPGNYPSVPGGDHDKVFNKFLALPVRFADNVTAANLVTGLEYWGVARYPTLNQTSAFNGIAQFFQGISESIHPFLVNPTLVCDRGTGWGVHSDRSYVPKLDIEGGGRIVGCAEGLHGSAEQVRIVGTLFQNVIDVNLTNMPSVSSYQENVMHKPLPGHPPVYIVLGDDRAWPGGAQMPAAGASQWVNQRGSQHRVKNWQGTGQDYRLFTLQQLASTAAWPSTDVYPHMFNAPDAGMTMGEAWAKYGIAYRGEALNDAEAVKLEGLVRGLAHPGLDAPLGPPRGVVTLPNSREPARIDKGTVKVYATMTGDPKAASDVLMVSVDGGKPFFVNPPPDGYRDIRTFTTSNIAPGGHEIRTWRTDANRRPIDASLMTFHYSVGVATESQPSKPQR